MRNVFHFSAFCAILSLRPFSMSPKRGKEVAPMNGFVTFIQTVGAQVVAYYLCKWLDSLIGKGSKH